MKVSLQVDKRFSSQVKRRWLSAIVNRTLATAKADTKAQLDLTITDDTMIRALNKTFRNIDRPTDVLAFPLKEESSDDPFVTPPEDLPTLGEVIVSYPTAAKQAESHGHSVDRELAILVIHGVLHLVGYDHATDEEEREMRALEEKTLRQLEDTDSP
jgi:probable rRNA maturation factor